MSILTKLILPLVDNGLASSYLNKNDGFVDAFLKDINKPDLDNHIFLVYEETTLPNYIRIMLTGLPTFYSKYIERIKGKYYEVFAFIRNINYRKDVTKLLVGNTHISDAGVSNILLFYNDTEAYITVAAHSSISVDMDEIPIEDYIPQFSEEIDYALNMDIPIE